MDYTFGRYMGVTWQINVVVDWAYWIIEYTSRNTLKEKCMYWLYFNFLHTLFHKMLAAIKYYINQIIFRLCRQLIISSWGQKCNPISHIEYQERKSAYNKCIEINPLDINFTKLHTFRFPIRRLGRWFFCIVISDGFHFHASFPFCDGIIHHSILFPSLEQINDADGLNEGRGKKK